MNARITLALVLVTCCFSAAVRADSPAEVLKDAAKLTNDYGTIIDKARSGADAKEAAPKVGELAKAAAELKARADKLDAPNDEQKAEIAKAVGKDADHAAQVLIGTKAQLDKNGEREGFEELTKAGESFTEAIAPVLSKFTGVTLDDSHDRLMGDAVGIMNTMADALAGAKDEATAKVAAEKIKALEVRTRGFKARADLLGEPSQEQVQSLMQKHMAGLMTSSQKLQAEAVRILLDLRLP